MDKAKAKAISAEALVALQAVAAKHGLKVTANGGTVDFGSTTLKFMFAETGESGVVMTPQATEFQMFAEGYGLKSDDLGRTFTYAGKVYTIVGLKPRSRLPILASSGERTYKFAAKDVARLLAA